MRTFTVHLLTPYCSWEGVEANNEKEAISHCSPIAEPDAEYQTFVAIEEKNSDRIAEAIDIVENSEMSKEDKEQVILALESRGEED